MPDVTENKAAYDEKIPYCKPVLVHYGSLQSMTRTTKGGNPRDGGPGAFHGPVVTGGTFDIDSSFYDEASHKGSSQDSDVFE